MQSRNPAGPVYVCSCWSVWSDISSDALRKVCRCSELVRRAAVMLSVAATVARQTDGLTTCYTHAPTDNHTRLETEIKGLPSDCWPPAGPPGSDSRSPLDKPSTSNNHKPAGEILRPPSDLSRPLSGDARQAAEVKRSRNYSGPPSDKTGPPSGNLETKNIPRNLHLDLSALSDRNGPPPATQKMQSTDFGAVKPIVPSVAVESTQQAVQLVIQATDELCHMANKHLSQNASVTSSASTTSAVSSRRMLPIVPGTSIVPGTALLPSFPGAAGIALRCHSARDRALSRHISLMCFPLRQNSSDV